MNWTEIYVTAGGQKAHLFADCRYLNQSDPMQKSWSDYPDGWLEMCEHCVSRVERRKAREFVRATQCWRCGTKTEQQFCSDCKEVV